jgi:hypothetical protein
MRKSSYSYHIHEATMMKHERSRSIGVAGKVDVLDEIQIISRKRLTTVRRYGWL